MRFYLLLNLFFCFSLSSIAQPDSEQACVDGAQKIEQKLSCLKGLAFKEVQNQTGSQLRVFEMIYSQPADHANPQAGVFNQRVVLLHRAETEPMVLQTSGYLIFQVAESEISEVFGTNQIQVEHRFFANSKPAVLNWGLLNVQQSAMDFHRITVALKKIYKARWVNTGASKGGMTSVYHRRFFPDDLDGTLADVAPISYAKSDAAFAQFVDRVGGYKYQNCRAALKQVQISLLRHRDTVLPKIKGEFSQLGNKEVAYEHAVTEMPFAFWQYNSPEDARVGCQKIPTSGTIAQQFAYLQQVNTVDNYTDASIRTFQPYYFQAATQLGGPAVDRSHLKDFIKFPFSIDQYMPKGVNFAYSNALMRNVGHWVRNQSSKMMFVYGEFDPWTAGEHPLNQEANQRYKFMQPGGNHMANFTTLPPSQKEAAKRILAGWLNKNPVMSARRSRAPSLEQIEAAYRSRFKL